MNDFKCKLVAIEKFLTSIAGSPRCRGEKAAKAVVTDFVALLKQFSGKEADIPIRFDRREKYFRFSAFGFLFDLKLLNGKLGMEITNHRTEYLGLDGIFKMTINTFTDVESWQKIHNKIADAIDAEQCKVAKALKPGRYNTEEFYRSNSGYSVKISGFNGSYGFTVDNKKGESCGAVNFYEATALVKLMKMNKMAYGKNLDFWIVDKRKKQPFLCIEPCYVVIHAIREIEVNGETRYIGKFNNNEERTYSISERFFSDDTIVNETYCHELDMKFKRCPADIYCSIISEWLTIREKQYKVIKNY